jgi:hypothetical protein
MKLMLGEVIARAGGVIPSFAPVRATDVRSGKSHPGAGILLSLSIELPAVIDLLDVPNMYGPN